MTEGRIISQPEVNVVLTPTVQPSTGVTPDKEVGVDILRYFNLGLDIDAKTTRTLKEISQWAFTDVDTVGDGLLKLKQLEMRLGIPSGNETREDKLFNWIKMQKQIEDLQKRQEALR